MRIPGIGEVQNKWVYAGGGIVALAVGYTYWRRRGATSADPAAADQLPEDGTTGDVADGFGNVPGQTGDSTGGWVPDGDRDPATVDEWTALAVSRMADIGYDAQAVADAIGRWLDRQGLTAAQADTIRTVKAIMPKLPGYDVEPPIQVGLPSPPSTGGDTSAGGAHTKPGRRLLPAGTRPTIPDQTVPTRDRVPLFQSGPTRPTPR